MDITIETLRAIAPTARSGLVGPIADACSKHLERYGIDTPLRAAHFLAQAAHESAGFTTLEELGGQAYFRKYETGTPIGKRLGNTQPGDGYRFRGRGIFQCTGRSNYALYGKRIGKDLLSDPELAAEPETSVRIACEYWKARGLSDWADQDDVVEITRRINGGSNGLAERRKYLARAKKVLGADGGIVGLVDTTLVPDAPIAAEAPKGMLQSKEGLASLGIGGITLADAASYVERHVMNRLDDDSFVDRVLILLREPRIQVALVVVVLAGMVWFWRWRRMWGHA